MSNETSVIITLLTLAGGALTAFISTYVRKKKKPKSEYIDIAFEKMEKLMKIVEDDNVRLRIENAGLIVENGNLRRKVNGMETREIPGDTPGSDQ